MGKNCPLWVIKQIESNEDLKTCFLESSQRSILSLDQLFDKHCGLWQAQACGYSILSFFLLFLFFFNREMEWRLDKEGREYHHYEDFCKLYRSEILNLNRMLDMLSKNGMLPGNLNLNFSVSNVSVFQHRQFSKFFCENLRYWS